MSQLYAITNSPKFQDAPTHPVSPPMLWPLPILWPCPPCGSAYPWLVPSALLSSLSSSVREMGIVEGI